MSHFTKIKTKLTDINTLERSLKRSLQWETKRNSIVRGYQDNTINAELVSINPHSSYDVGFIKNDNAYELVTDFYGLKNYYTQENLLRLITQNYSLSVIEDEAMENNFIIGVPEYEKDGSIRLVLSR